MPTDRHTRLIAAAREARDRIDLDAHQRLVDDLESESDGDPYIALVVSAERLRDTAYVPMGDDEYREVLTRIGELLGDSHVDHAIKARLLLGRAALRARLLEPGWGTDAARDFEAAAVCFSAADDMDGAAKALGFCAWTLDLLVSGLRQSRARMTESIQLAQSASVRIGALTQRAKINLWLGDLEAAGADIATCRSIEGDLNDATVAYIAWAEILVLSARGEKSQIRAALDRADAHLAAWHTTITGAQFEAEMADALALAGMEVESWTRLARAQTRSHENPDPVMAATLAVNARIGDAAVAVDCWGKLQDSTEIEQWEMSRLGILAAYAMQRLEVDAGATAATAFETAARHTLPEMLVRREPVCAPAVLDAAVAAGSPAAARMRRSINGHRVEVIDGVRIVDPTGKITAVTGRVATLFAAMAGSTGAQHASQLGAAVWPEDEDSDDLAARVRRLIHRARAAAPIIDREDDGRLRLADDTGSDLEDLDVAVARTRAAEDGGMFSGHLDEARALAAGTNARTLDLRDDLPEAVRSRLQRQLHWVHRRAAAFEADRGRDDLARHELRLALTYGPDDDVAAAMLARSLLAEGRRHDAAQVLLNTAATLQDYGVKPSRTFTEMTKQIVM